MRQGTEEVSKAIVVLKTKHPTSLLTVEDPAPATMYKTEN